MAKYKVCPNCKHLNPPTVLECEECEADLSTIRVSDSETILTEAPQAAEARAEKEQQPFAAPAAQDRPVPKGELFRKRDPETRPEPVRPQPPVAAAGMVRFCEECGSPNPANSRKCEKYGEDISDIIPAPGTVEKPKTYLLSSLDGAVTFSVPEGETVLGREAELSGYLESRMYVGRRQAKICLKNGKLTIENLKATNYTFVNNQSIDSRIVELKDGDEIGLGGNSVNGQRQEYAAYFRVVLQ